MKTKSEKRPSPLPRGKELCLLDAAGQEWDVCQTGVAAVQAPLCGSMAHKVDTRVLSMDW